MNTGSLFLERCRIQDFRAHAGAIIYIKGGKATVIDSYINNTLAGFGGGVANILAGEVQFVRTEIGLSRSSIYEGAVFSQSGGKLRLVTSNITNPISSGSWFRVSSKGAFECQQSLLSAAAGHNNATLFEDTANDVMFVGCSIQNLKLANQLAPIAARNSQFQPALDARRTPWQGCKLAGCDHRIRSCSAASTGGVECYCAQASLLFEGTVDDGGNCIEPTSTQLYTQATELDVVVRKPLPSISRKLVLSSRGDTTVNVTFALSEYDGNWNLIQARFISSYTDATLPPGNGLFVIWGASNTSEKLINPGGETLNPAGLQLEKFQSFSLSFNCSLYRGLAAPNAPHCAKDGDVAHLVLSMYTRGDRTELTTMNISMTARVEALPSCKHSKANSTISPDVALLDHRSPTGLAVLFGAMDVDNQPIMYTTPQLEVLWGRDTSERLISIPYKREGENIFKGLISMQHFSRPGMYTLKVRLKSGWNSTLQQETSCTVLTRKVKVRSNLLTLLPEE